MTTEMLEELPAAPGFIRGPHPARPRKRKQLTPAQRRAAEAPPKKPWQEHLGRKCPVCGWAINDVGEKEHPSCEPEQGHLWRVTGPVVGRARYRAGGR